VAKGGPADDKRADLKNHMIPRAKKSYRHMKKGT
jgi:hypothetical protein